MIGSVGRSGFVRICDFLEVNVVIVEFQFHEDRVPGPVGTAKVEISATLVVFSINSAVDIVAATPIPVSNSVGTDIMNDLVMTGRVARSQGLLSDVEFSEGPQERIENMGSVVGDVGEVTVAEDAIDGLVVLGQVTSDRCPLGGNQGRMEKSAFLVLEDHNVATVDSSELGVADESVVVEEASELAIGNESIVVARVPEVGVGDTTSGMEIFEDEVGLVLVRCGLVAVTLLVAVLVIVFFRELGPLVAHTLSLTVILVVLSPGPGGITGDSTL